MLSSRLKKLRHEKDILQKDIANKLNISTSAYGFYEQGKRAPDISTLQKLADFFDVSVDYLLGRTNEKKETTSTDGSKNDTLDNLGLPEEVVKSMELFFMNGSIAEEDKENVMRDILDLYWKAKGTSKKK